MFLGMELVDKQIAKLQLHIRVQHGWIADGRLVPQQEPVCLDLLFLYVGP